MKAKVYSVGYIKKFFEPNVDIDFENELFGNKEEALKLYEVFKEEAKELIDGEGEENIYKKIEDRDFNISDEFNSYCVWSVSYTHLVYKRQKKW